MAWHLVFWQILLKRSSFSFLLHLRSFTYSHPTDRTFYPLSILSFFLLVKSKMAIAFGEILSARSQNTLAIQTSWKFIISKVLSSFGRHARFLALGKLFLVRYCAVVWVLCLLNPYITSFRTFINKVQDCWEKNKANLDNETKLFSSLDCIFRNRDAEESKLGQRKNFSLRSYGKLVRFKTANNPKRWALCYFKLRERQKILRNNTHQGRVLQFLDIYNERCIV